MSINSINVGGNAINSVLASGNVGGNISVRITSSGINQSQESPDFHNKDISEILLMLQKAIKEEVQLSSEDKADLLEQVKAFEEAIKTNDQDKKAGIVRKAKKIFEATLNMLPYTAKLVEESGKLLPIILKPLGF